ncbi:hypothetical protein JCM8547_007554 [Rhodosporidiobolus lusitaniae]
MTTPLISLPNNTATSWWADRSLRKNVLAAIVCYFGTYSLGYDGSYMTGLQSMPTWTSYFDHPAGNKLGIISASSYLPSLILTPFYGWMADKFGRRFCAIFGGWIIIAGSLIGAFANGLAMLIVGRALVGTGGFVMIMGSNLLVNELLHPRLRPIGSAFFLVFYYVGSSLSAWVTFGIVASGWLDTDWSWRLPTLLQALGPAIVAVGTMFLPESPRWLVAKGRREDALRVLASHHSNGKLDDELVQQELIDMESAIERERQAQLGLMSFFKTKGNRHRLIILLATSVGAQLNGASVFSYYLAPVLRLVGLTKSQEQTGINAGLAMWNLVIATCGAAFVDRIGRRKLWLTSTIGMLISYCILTGCSAGFESTRKESMGLATVAFIFLSYGFYSLGWTPLPYPYTTEVLPYSMRASGIGLFIWLKNATLCFTQWVNPIGLAAGGWKYYFLFVGTLTTLTVVIYFYFIETKGLTLEEVCSDLYTSTLSFHAAAKELTLLPFKITLLFDGDDSVIAATSLEDRKEAADAQVKFGNKNREISHLERKLSEEESV